MTIFAKLALAIGVPAAILILLGGGIVYQSNKTVSEMDDIQQLAQFSRTVSALVHETQKERGNTAGFLGSSDDSFTERLADQRRSTNVQLANFAELLKQFDVERHGPAFAELVHEAEAQISELDVKRNLISARSLTTPQAIGYYTRINTLLLDAVGKAAQATRDGSIAVRINAYCAFLKSKERAGIERAVLSNTFAKDAFGPKMYDKFVSLVALQDSFLKEFANLATTEDRAYYNDKLNVPAVDQVNAFRQIARDKAAEGGFGQDAGLWFDTITQKINLLKQVDDHLASGLMAQANRSSNQAKATLLSVSVFVGSTCLAVLVGGYLVVYSIRKRLARFASSVDQIAEGDLTIRLDEAKDEIGQFSERFNRMLVKMSAAISCITEQSTSLKDSSVVLSETAEEMKADVGESKMQSAVISSAAEEMSTNMAQTSAATEQMSVGIATIHQTLESVRSSAERVTSQSEQSAGLVQNAMDRIEAGSDRFTQLSNSAGAIDSVIGVIQDIAEQTNLLALNATIEAARAGEAGKGFAVVATEVKELAGQSSQAIEGIREEVAAIQISAKETVEVVNEVSKIVGEVRESTEAIAGAINQQNEDVANITTTMAQSKDAALDVSRAVSESAVATQEIAKSVVLVDNTLRNTIKGADQTYENGANLAGLTVELEHHVSQFQV